MEINSLYKLKSKFVAREVGDELIIVPLSANVAQMNELFTLNETAKVIWDQLDEHSTFDNLLQAITNSFETDEATAKKDIELFLIKLNGLLKK